MAGCGRESVIVFGAVEKTNRQVTDGFHEWYYGYPEERQRNFMGKDHITAEEYLNQVWDYSRRIYLCVKFPRKGYYLSELMDEQQKVWFPVFMEETVDKFFRSEPDSDE